MELLATALEANLPLITCRTTDVINAPKVLSLLAGSKFAPAMRARDRGIIGPYQYVIGDEPIPDGLIEDNVAKERTLVIVNPTEEYPEAFDAGEIPVPDGMARTLLKQMGVAPAAVEGLLAELHGLTLKEMAETCRLTMTAFGELTPARARTVRAAAMGRVRGVDRVTGELGFYYVPYKVQQYVQSIGRFLTVELEPRFERLVPRGVLLSGIPGTGKTMAAKYIARHLDVPLMRLDLGALMSKYVGESETNLRTALASIESASPCVMLVDEVEKLFAGTDDSGVTQNLLAALLWWMQERRSRVLVCMTTNDKEALPTELIRAGRLDMTLTMPDHEPDPISFVEALLKDMGVAPYEIEMPDKGTKATPAALTAATYSRVRATLDV